MGKTLNTYINRLFEDEEKGREWAQHKLRDPKMKDYDLEMSWRKIKYAPEQPDIFSVSFRKKENYNA